MIQLKPKEIANLPIVRIGEAATVMMHENSDGTFVGYPLRIKYPGNDNDFRFQFYEELNKLWELNKLPEVFFLLMEPTGYKALVDKPSYETMLRIVKYAASAEARDSLTPITVLRNALLVKKGFAIQTFNAYTTLGFLILCLYLLIYG